MSKLTDEKIMNFQIKKPTEKDMIGVQNIFSDWWRDSGGNIEKEEVNYWTEKVKDAMTRKTVAKYLVAINSENVVCGIIGWRENIHEILLPYVKKKAVELHDLFIAKKSEHLGIGQSLVKYFLNEVKDKYEEVIFVSAERWKDSWTFYNKLGFKRVVTTRSEKTGKLYQIFQMDL